MRLVEVFRSNPIETKLNQIKPLQLQGVVLKMFDRREDASDFVISFFYLRVICPAIQMPEGWVEIMPAAPTRKLRRTLTLATKALQKLANKTKFSKSEAFMRNVLEQVKRSNGGVLSRFFSDVRKESIQLGIRKRREMEKLASFCSVCRIDYMAASLSSCWHLSNHSLPAGAQRPATR